MHHKLSSNMPIRQLDAIGGQMEVQGAWSQLEGKMMARKSQIRSKM
jgi:hypothetical protein